MSRNRKTKATLKKAALAGSRSRTRALAEEFEYIVAALVRGETVTINPFREGKASGSKGPAAPETQPPGVQHISHALGIEDGARIGAVLITEKYDPVSGEYVSVSQKTVTTLRAPKKAGERDQNIGTLKDISENDSAARTAAPILNASYLETAPDVGKVFSTAASDEEIGSLYKAARKKRGLTQIDVAKKIDSSQEVVSRFERGKFSASPEWRQQYLEAIGYVQTIVLQPKN